MLQDGGVIVKLKTALATCVVVATLAASGGTALSVPTEDEQIPSPHTSATGAHGVEMNEVSGLRDNVSVLVGSGGTKICSSTLNPSCSTSSGYYFRAVLGPCTSTTTVDCIEGVSATRGGTVSSGAFSRFFPARGVTDFTGSTADGVPDGVAPGLWSFPSVPHSNGTDYQVTVQIVGSKKNGNALSPQRTFFANITPVSIYQTTCAPQFNGHCMDTYYEGTGSNGMPTVRFAGVAADQDGGFRCQNWGENSQCALKHAFPSDVKFSLKVRLRTTPHGWLHGRMLDPIATITTESNVTTVVVEAAPVKVPVVAASADWLALPASIQQFFSTCATCGTRRHDNQLFNPAVRNLVSQPLAYKTTSFEQLELWKSFTADSAYAVPSVWNVRTLSDSEMSNAPSCIRNGGGVTGVVSTNATLYAEGPPAYDSTRGTLSYKVAAPHYMRDGVTPFSGYYGLLLREDIAECLYGAPDFTSASTVTVSSESGATKAATTTMSRTNGWFRFVANGYTHSAPTVKVKLSPKWPTLRTGRKLSTKTIAKTYGMSVPTKAAVTAAVSSRSTKVCSVKAGAIVGKRKGTCTLKISVKPAPTKKVPRPKTVSKTVKVVIS
jgi:hypothetical protein